MPERRVHGRRRWDLEEREASRPGKELGDVEGLTPAEPDDRAGAWQTPLERDELVELERLDEVDAAEMWAGQELLEPRPQVGHRDDEIWPMHEGGELGHELVTEDGREPAGRQRPSLDHDTIASAAVSSLVS